MKRGRVGWQGVAPRVLERGKGGGSLYLRGEGGARCQANKRLNLLSIQSRSRHFI